MEAQELGFAHVESGPLVRSSYHAERQAAGSLRRRHAREGSGEVIPLSVVPGTGS